jgi:hypothetical protein
MGMRDQHGIDPSQSILREPLNSGCLEILPDVDDDSPEVQPLLKPTFGRCRTRTNLGFPSFPSIRITVEVFLRIFFFPSGLKVDRHVLQGVAVSGAVRQDTFGKLPDVPVPKKMSSTPGAGCTRRGELSESGMEHKKYPRVEKKLRVESAFRWRVINLQGTASMAIDTPPKR